MTSLRDLFFQMLKPESVGLTVFALCAVTVAGLAFGKLKVKGISLGVGGVVFSGLAFGRVLGNHALNAEVIEFARDFGLILFIYTIGVQAGPGFLASLRKQGLPLNLLAAGVVLIGVGLTIVISKVGGVPMNSAVGLFSGGTTNTPSLAAAAQALRETKGQVGAPAVAGYAIAYPFGIVGIILIMLLFRRFFRIDLEAEAKAIARANPPAPTLKRICLTVTNTNLDGHALLQIPVANSGTVVVSRIVRDGQVKVAYPDTFIQSGDTLLAVGPAEELENLRLVVGEVSPLDPTTLPSRIVTRTIVVTRNEVLGKTVDELNLDDAYGVRATRVRRGEVELPPSPSVSLQFGDKLTVVGDEESIKAAGAKIGDSVARLDHAQVIPIFVGIALGVLLGSIPVYFPGMPAPVRLGLAGGPLVAALVVSRLGHLGPLVWYLPRSANLAIREIGICLFLSAVGVKAGDQFFNTLLHGSGLLWMVYGALITAVPLLIMGAIARVLLKLDFMSICGLLSGSMTDPPALAFATSVTNSDSPSIAYAAVYPLVMLMRVLAAQILVLIFV